MKKYIISTDKSKLDLNIIHNFLTNQSYWAEGRSFKTVKCSVENSFTFGMYDENENMIGFARVITDYCIFAYLLDVFILKSHQNQGLGTKLIEYILGNASIKGINKIMLATKDAHGFYENFGFSSFVNSENLMELVTNYS